MDSDEKPTETVPDEPAADTAKKDGAAVGGVVALFAVLAIIVIVVIGVALTGSEEDRPSSVFTLSGALELPASGASVTGQSCTGGSGYSDIRPNAVVTVYDASGEVAGTGPLGAGRVSGSVCVFRFDVHGIVRAGDRYQVEVASRGKVAVTATEAEAGLVSLTLG